MSKIVVVGANHAGTACINTMLDNFGNENEIVVFDQNSNISFLGCGMALWIGEQIDGAEGLFYSDKEKLHILSILDIKKMIPVPTDCYERIDFNELEDIRYKDLFQKEYAFCLKIKTKVLIKVEIIYKKQKKTGIIRRANCNFSKLEKAMLDWKQ